MELKQNIFEEGPLGDGWILITGGSVEIKKKKSEGCEVKKASDGKRYYKCPTNNVDEKPWPDELKCVTTGTKKPFGNNKTQFYYTLKVNNEDWNFTRNGRAAKSDQDYWTNLYKCENGKPKIYSVCDLDGKELKGEDGDPWEYKKIEGNNRTDYCVRKKGSSIWKYVTWDNPNNKKSLDAIAKKFQTEGGNIEGGDKDKEKGIGGDEDKDKEIGGDKKKEEVKYPSKAPQNIVDRFDTNYPCLKDLPTMVNLDKDGIEYYYKVEKPNMNETVFYYLSGQCIIKKGDQLSPIKYFRCPQK